MPEAEGRTRLILVRHGESNATVQQIVGGPNGCTGLSEVGRRQCEALRDRFLRTGEVKADILLASTLPRAIETAQIIAPGVGASAEVVTDCDLCELHPGESDTLPWHEYQERYGDGFGTDPHRPFSPGGETLAEFQARAGAALERLATEHEGGTIVVATHGGVVQSSIVKLMGLPTDRPSPVELWVFNTSITEWVRTEAGWRLVRYNDAAHLSSGAPDA